VFEALTLFQLFFLQAKRDCVASYYVTNLNIQIQQSIEYTGCPGRNVPDFGRMFLKLKYTDKTQNTYIRSWTVTEITAREKCGLLAVPPTLPGSRDILPYTAHVRPSVYSRVKRTHTATARVKCLEP